MAECAIENDNPYINNFANSLQPQPTQGELQAQQMLEQANTEIKNRDQQIIDLQKQLNDLQMQQQLQAYSMDKEIEMAKLKHSQEMEKMILTEKLKQANPAEQAKTEAEIVKSKASIEKEALSLQKAELTAAKDIIGA